MKASPVLGSLGFKHISTSCVRQGGEFRTPACRLVVTQVRTLPFSLDDLEFGGISESFRPPGNPTAPKEHLSLMGWE